MLDRDETNDKGTFVSMTGVARGIDQMYWSDEKIYLFNARMLQVEKLKLHPFYLL